MTGENATILSQLLEKLPLAHKLGNTPDKQRELAQLALQLIREKRQLLGDQPENGKAPQGTAEELNELHSQVKEYQAQVAELEKQNINLKELADSNLQMMQMTINYMLTEIEELRHTASEGEEESQALQEALQEMESKKAEADELSKALQEAQQKLQEQGNSQIAQEQLIQEIEGKEAEVNQLSQALQEAEQKLQAQQSSIQSNNETEQQHQQAIEALKGELKEKSDELDRCLLDLQAKSEEATELEARNQELSEKLGSLREKKQLLEQQMREELQLLKQEIEASVLQQAEVVEAREEAVAETHGSSLQNSIDFTQKINQACFRNEERLFQLFPNTTYFAHPSETYNGNLLHISEKFGVTYLVMIKAVFKGLEGQIFKMASNFALNNIIKVKKYINSSKLIEEFFYSMEPSLSMLGIDAESVGIGVCLIDRTNLELEFSSSGLSIFLDKGQSELIEVKGGRASAEDAMNKRFGLNNAYQVKKVNLLSRNSLILSSLPLSTEFNIQEGDSITPYTFHEFLLLNIHSEADEFKQSLQQLFDGRKLNPNQEAADFLLAKIGF